MHDHPLRVLGVIIHGMPSYIATFFITNGGRLWIVIAGYWARNWCWKKACQRHLCKCINFKGYSWDHSNVYSWFASWLMYMKITVHSFIERLTRPLAQFYDQFSPFRWLGNRQKSETSFSYSLTFFFLPIKIWWFSLTKRTWVTKSSQKHEIHQKMPHRYFCWKVEMQVKISPRIYGSTNN